MAPEVIRVLARRSGAAAEAARNLIDNENRSVNVLSEVLRRANDGRANEVYRIRRRGYTCLINGDARTNVIPFAAVNEAATGGRFKLIFGHRDLRFVMVRASNLLVRIVASNVMRGSKNISDESIERITAIVRVRSRRYVTQFRTDRRGNYVNLDPKIKLRVNVFNVGGLTCALGNRDLRFICGLTSAVVALTKVTLNVFVDRP